MREPSLSQPSVDAAIAYALHRLAAELPADLTYHSLAHTRDEVLPAATELAQRAGLGARETALLRIAAAFHDVGYIERPDDHEICSVRILAQVLPVFGFDARSTEDAMSLVLVTRPPAVPPHPSAGADVRRGPGRAGSEDFLDRSLDLLAERRAYGYEVTDADWWHQQIDFLSEHRYWTEVAGEWRDAGKERNAFLLRQRLAEALGGS